MLAALRYLIPLVLLAVIAVGSLGGGAEDPSPVKAYVGARIIPVTAPEIADGVLLVEGESIAAVGKRGEVTIPEGAEVIDLKGKILFPGLICTHSHVGKVQGGDGSSPIQPGVRVLDSIDVLDSTLEKARAGGITMANLMSGSGHLLSGQTAYLKLRDGVTVEELALRNEDGSMAGGIKMANGTNSIKGSGGTPGPEANPRPWFDPNSSRPSNIETSLRGMKGTLPSAISPWKPWLMSLREGRSCITTLIDTMTSSPCSASNKNLDSGSYSTTFPRHGKWQTRLRKPGWPAPSFT